LAYIDETYIQYYILPADYAILVPSDSARDIWITAAEDLIDSFLRPVYEVPFDEPPPSIKKIAVDIFEYFAHLRGGIVQDRVQKSYDLAIENLTKFGKRELLLTDKDSVVEDSYRSSRFLSNTKLGVKTDFEKHVGKM